MATKEEKEAEKVTAEKQGRSDIPDIVNEAVLVQSLPIPDGTPEVHGVDFNKKPNLQDLLQGLRWSGFQATHLGKAIERVNEMIKWRPSPKEVKEYIENDLSLSKVEAENTRTKIFLGLTSNMISSGTREVIRYLVQHNMVDCIVTTGGGIEEDFMKCFCPHYHGAFNLKGKELRMKGHNRIGNLLVPNNTYCSFEDWFTPVWEQMLKEQKENGIIWTPSKMIRRMGREINNEESVWYWCYKNNIPVFCPAITDGAVGDVLYFNSFKDDEFILDIARDIRGMNDQARNALKTGMLILGGGVIKHHICNANLMRNGADFSVFVNTGQEFDGSDSGARPDEAISWGKIRLDAKPVKVYGDATVMFPLIVAGSFFVNEKEAKKPRRKLIPGHECTPDSELKK